MNRTAIVGVLLAIGGVLAWVATRPMRAQAPPAVAGPPAAADGVVAVGEASPTAEPAWIEPIAAAPASREAARSTAIESTGARVPARVEVRVVAAETGLSVPNAVVQVHWTATQGTTAAHTKPERTASGTSDAGGRVALEVAPGIPLRIWASPRGLGGSPASLEVSPLAERETRAVEITLATRADRMVVGVVLGDEDDAPIAGARVLVIPVAQTRRAGANVLPTSHAAAPIASTTTDELGRFEVEAPTQLSTYLALEAAGRATELAPIPARGEARPGRWELGPVRLHRSAVLRARILDQEGRPAPGVEVRVVLDAGRVPPDPRRPDAFSIWSAWTGEDGACEVTGFPVRMALDLEIVREGSLLRRFRDQVEAEPGERREFLWRSASGASVRGVVVLEDGAPAGRGLPRELVAIENGTDRERVIAEAVTERDGRFVFEDVPDGTWRIRHGGRSTKGEGDGWSELHGWSELVPMLVTVEDAASVDEVRVVRRAAKLRALRR